MQQQTLNDYTFLSYFCAGSSFFICNNQPHWSIGIDKILDADQRGVLLWVRRNLDTDWSKRLKKKKEEKLKFGTSQDPSLPF